MSEKCTRREHIETIGICVTVVFTTSREREHLIFTLLLAPSATTLSCSSFLSPSLHSPPRSVIRTNTCSCSSFRLSIAEFGGEDPSENYYTRDAQGVFWCANCPLKTPHRRDLFRHIDAVHMDTQYPCQLCGRVLKAKYLLERHHKKLHTGNRKSRGPVNPLMGH